MLTKQFSILNKPVVSFFAGRVFKFFASLRLAVVVLISLMAVLAAGTFIESAYGTDAARILIYRSPWFALLLLILGINVAAAALDRLPWKKKHVGFVITHAGIILVLIGSFITGRFVVDGQMIIGEGETEYRINLPEPILFIFSQAGGRHWILPLQKHAFSWQGNQGIPAQGVPFSISLLTDYPKARMQEKIATTQTGPAALKVTLHSSFVNQEQWLLENDPERGEVQMGPAKLKFTNEFLKEQKGPLPEAGYLEFVFPLENGAEKKVFVPLNVGAVHEPPLRLPAVFPLEGTPYRIQLLRLFKDAEVRGKELIEGKDTSSEKPSDWKNPAAELLFEGNGIKEKHTVFSKFPDFPTIHGMKPSAAGVGIFYRMPNGGSRGESHELRFVQDEKGGLSYQIQSGLDIKTGKAGLGKEVPLGWMDMRFRIDEFYPHAAIEKKFNPAPTVSESEDAVPAIRLQVSPHPNPLPVGEGNTLKTFWLGQGMEENFQFRGQSYQFIYGEKRIPAGFKLTLKNFRIENYPGTDRPASFESDVTLKDDSRGLVKDVTISMNKPLVYRGYRIYQSGYNLPNPEKMDENRPGQKISVFSVGHDPGVPVTYAGAVIMVAGILTMFYTRKFSSHGGRLNE